MRFIGIAAVALAGTAIAAPLPSEQTNHLEKRLKLGGIGNFFKNVFSGDNISAGLQAIAGNMQQREQAAGDPYMTGAQGVPGGGGPAPLGVGRNGNIMYSSSASAAPPGNFFNSNANNPIASVPSTSNYGSSSGYGLGGTGSGYPSDPSTQMASGIDSTGGGYSGGAYSGGGYPGSGSSAASLGPWSSSQGMTK
ncbi:MAG: hypothetical protein M1823_003382 [Watsoniomyces obsoletus]|nr:MAG: hypothetical protein M1823_003382 [Watsoniomyces obsoletus]